MIKIRGSNPVFSLKLHITSDESIGHSWHVPTVQNCLKFMQFFGKFGNFKCMLVPPEGLVPPPMGKPGSVPDNSKYLN